jgi:BolA protein
MERQERKTVIEQRLQQAFSPTRLEVMDESHQHVGHEGAKAGGSHFAITIVADQFSGLSLLKRHQLVYEVLKDLIPHEIHALRINARTANELNPNH